MYIDLPRGYREQQLHEPSLLWSSTTKTAFYPITETIIIYISILNFLAKQFVLEVPAKILDYQYDLGFSGNHKNVCVCVLSYIVSDLYLKQRSDFKSFEQMKSHNRNL